MVIVKLMGGLGNQLFQYAAGRRLAFVHETRLKLDASALDNGAYRTIRQYGMGPFNVQQALATEKDIATLTRHDSGLFRSFLYKVAGKNVHPPASYIKEAHYHFDPAILELPDNVYLDGYWQSELYFSDIADVLRDELIVVEPPSGRNAELAHEILSSQAVSLHVRRGDYVSDPVTSQLHGTCDLGYYKRAVAYIEKYISNPVFFLFSDDPAWVRENLRLPYPMHVIDHNGENRAHEDLRLMSMCRHHIIANSSFSWWGAWLNPSPEKIVVAPRKWFHNDIITTDLIPNGWVRI